jgi:hypothetical protein
MNKLFDQDNVSPKALRSHLQLSHSGSWRWVFASSCTAPLFYVAGGGVQHCSDLVPANGFAVVIQQHSAATGTVNPPS